MAKLTNDQWMITFFYKQDLRSYYMNGLLNGGLHPGVYNTNLSLYTENPAASSTAGIYLYIKKGSSFIFSNSYKKERNSEILVDRRDFENPGSYLIKCTALKDISIPLISWAKGQASISSLRPEELLGENRCSEHYVVAKLNYNPDEEKAIFTPNFFIVDKKRGYNISEVADDYYFLSSKDKESQVTETGIVDKIILDHSDNYRIPDGSSRSNLEEISWLCLGKITEYPEIKNGAFTFKKSYLSLENDWAVGAAESWINNHSFSGQGLDDYRYSLFFDNVSKSPAVISNVEYTFSDNNRQTIQDVSTKLYLDFKNLNTGKNILSIENDNLAINTIGNKTPESFNNNLQPIKFFISDRGQISKEEENKVFKISENYWEKIQALGVDASKTVCDLVFMTISSSINNNYWSGLEKSKIDSLAALFNDNKETSGEKLKDLRTSKKFDIKEFQWIANIPDSYNLCPAFDNLTSFIKYKKGQKEKIEHTGYQTNYNDDTEITLTDKKIITLDTSQTNIDRLLRIISNSNIISEILSYLRYKEVITSQEDTVIPICLSFRQFVNIGSEEIKNITSTDNVSSQYIVNPSNIINLLDLDSRLNNISRSGLLLDNVYPSIPIIK